MATRNLSYSGTAADASTTTICTIPTGECGVQRLGLTVTNNGAVALDAFVISATTGQSTVFTTLASAAGDFVQATIVPPMIRSVGAPVTLAAAGVWFGLLDCHGLSQVRIAASGNAGACAVSVEASLG